LHCPIFELDITNRDQPRWEPIDGDRLTNAIRSFGLDSSTVMQILFGIMLVSLFAILQLIDDKDKGNGNGTKTPQPQQQHQQKHEK